MKDAQSNRDREWRAMSIDFICQSSFWVGRWHTMGGVEADVAMAEEKMMFYRWSIGYETQNNPKGPLIAQDRIQCKKETSCTHDSSFKLVERYYWRIGSGTNGRTLPIFARHLARCTCQGHVHCVNSKRGQRLSKLLRQTLYSNFWSPPDDS